jgi:chromosome segregation ATPase
MTEDPDKLDIEQLRKKHKDLEGKKIAAQTNLKNAEDQLSRLKQEAREKWDTDDLEELKQKLENMKTDNENKRASYQQHVEQIETRLSDVEREYADSHLGTK